MKYPTFIIGILVGVIVILSIKHCDTVHESEGKDAAIQNLNDRVEQFKSDSARNANFQAQQNHILDSLSHRKQKTIVKYDTIFQDINSLTADSAGRLLSELLRQYRYQDSY